LNAYKMGIEWSRIFPTSTREVKVAVVKNEFNRISDIEAKGVVFDKLDEIANTNAIKEGA